MMTPAVSFQRCMETRAPRDIAAKLTSGGFSRVWEQERRSAGEAQLHSSLLLGLDQAV